MSVPISTVGEDALKAVLSDRRRGHSAPDAVVFPLMSPTLSIWHSACVEAYKKKELARCPLSTPALHLSVKPT